MKPRAFAIDFDGVIADTNSRKSAWIRQNLHQHVSPDDCDRTSCEVLIGSANYDRVSAWAYSADTTRSTPPIPGALDGLTHLFGLGEPFVLTARSDENAPAAEEWLKRHMAPNVPQLVTLPGPEVTKLSIVQRRGAELLFEDDARHLTGAAEKSVGAFLLRRAGDSTEFGSTGIHVVRSWREFLIHVEGETVLGG